MLKPFVPSERTSRTASILRGVRPLPLHQTPKDGEMWLRTVHPDDRDALHIVQRGGVLPASTSDIIAFNQTVIADLIDLLCPTSVQ